MDDGDGDGDCSDDDELCLEMTRIVALADIHARAARGIAHTHGGKEWEWTESTSKSNAAAAAACATAFHRRFNVNQSSGDDSVHEGVLMATLTREG